jgi:hypothetical protein
MHIERIMVPEHGRNERREDVKIAKPPARPPAQPKQPSTIAEINNACSPFQQQFPLKNEHKSGAQSRTFFLLKWRACIIIVAIVIVIIIVIVWSLSSSSLFQRVQTSACRPP